MKKYVLLLVVCIALITSMHAQNKKVGINTTTPAAMLHVKDSSVVFTGIINGLPPNLAPPPVSGLGARMMWYTGKSAFRVGQVDGPEWDRDSIGYYSAAFNFGTKAKGNSSFAIGSGTLAAGIQSFAGGTSTKALGSSSFSMGINTIASGAHAVAFGSSSIASGVNSTAFGQGCDATGSGSTAMGLNSVASGSISTAIGFAPIASGAHSTALGTSSIASGIKSIAIGYGAKAKSFMSCVVGSFNDTISTSSDEFVLEDPIFVIGNGSTANFRHTAMTVLKNGDAGIGTSSPQARFHVSKGVSGAVPISSAVGVFEDNSFASINLLTPPEMESAIYFGNPINSSAGGVVYNSTPSNGLSFRTNGNVSRAVIDGAGNFGIGDNSPNAKFHVNAGAGGGLYLADTDIIIEDNEDAYIQFSTIEEEEAGIFAGSPATTVRSGIVFTPDSSFQIRTGGNNVRVTVNKSGNTGIGVASPTQKLHVSGNGLFTGTVTASCGVLSCSDIRYKNRITPLTNSLRNLLSIHGIYYFWDKNKFSQMPFEDKQQIGFLAQEIESIYPEMVHTDENGYKLVDYSRLTPVLVEAIKEQQTIISSQQLQLDSLEKEMQELKITVLQLLNAKS